MTSFYSQVLAALRECDCDAKCHAVEALRSEANAGRFDIVENSANPEPVDIPGRPSRPLLVPPREVERRQVSTLPGRAALIHALAHIEFNAINLALDAAYRFRGLPNDYYRDWLRVAAEEANHFVLLRDHLRTLGYDYGSFTAHNGLWEMALKTTHDPLVRMALVPRVLEARGLDVSPTLIAKLKGCNDARAVEILEIIQRDEINHVSIGNRWYHYLCAQRGVDPTAMFFELLNQYAAPATRTPLARAARRQAGFTDRELELLSVYGVSTPVPY